jgi:hypothetical protein
LSQALSGTHCSIHLILSGNDITAQTFYQWYQQQPANSAHIHQISEADHTFSRKQWLDQILQLSERLV